MGAHKFNPIAQKAKEGLLPPKQPKMSKRETEELIFEEMVRRYEEKTETPFMSLPQYQRDIFVTTVAGLAPSLKEPRNLIKSEDKYDGTILKENVDGT